MLLFQSRFHEGLVNGSITLTFRLWPKARVKPGTRYRCHPIGVLEVEAVERIRVREISESDALRSGFLDRASLLDYLQKLSSSPLTGETEIFRVMFHYGGEEDFVPLAMETELSAESLAALLQRLQKMDSSGERPWTRETLSLIEKHPRIAASRLARMVQRETKPFKADVVKLKKLGLTQSFEIGYELTPRGRAVHNLIADQSNKGETT